MVSHSHPCVPLSLLLTPLCDCCSLQGRLPRCGRPRTRPWTPLVCRSAGERVGQNNSITVAQFVSPLESTASHPVVPRLLQYHTAPELSYNRPCFEVKIRNSVAFSFFVLRMSTVTCRLALRTTRLLRNTPSTRQFASSAAPAQSASAKSTPIPSQTAFQAIRNDRTVAVTFPNGTESE